MGYPETWLSYACLIIMSVLKLSQPDQKEHASQLGDLSLSHHHHLNKIRHEAEGKQKCKPATTCKKKALQRVSRFSQTFLRRVVEPLHLQEHAPRKLASAALEHPSHQSNSGDRGILLKNPEALVHSVETSSDQNHHM